MGLETEVELELVFREWEITETCRNVDMIYIWMCYKLYCMLIVNQLLIHIYILQIYKFEFGFPSNYGMNNYFEKNHLKLSHHI